MGTHMRGISIFWPITPLFAILFFPINMAFGQEAAPSIPTKDALAKCLADAKNLKSETNASRQLIHEDPCAYLSRRYIDRGEVNKIAQMLHGVDEVRIKYGLKGKGITVGLWDGGFALPTHKEFVLSEVDSKSHQPLSRITLMNAGRAMISIGPHATHVAGTIAAEGKILAAEGMAPSARILSYSYMDSDYPDFDQAVTAGVSVTNHSYGQMAGWKFARKPAAGCKSLWRWFGRDEDKDAIGFGRYDDESEVFDKAVTQHPTLSIFASAGNSRNWDFDLDSGEEPFDGHYCMCDFGSGQACSESTTPRAHVLRKNGYDTIPGGKAISKNVITVGAMNVLRARWTREDIKVTHFSSLGPADDGRIKPDIIAEGEAVYSTAPWKECGEHGEEECPVETTQLKSRGTSAGYEEKGGTSMASPVTAGIAALLEELSIKKQGRVLYADEMKATLIHTAQSKLANDGPTYDAGWGAIQALPAAALVKGDEGILQRLAVRKAQVLEVPLSWKNEGKARVTVAWLDQAGNAKSVKNAAIDDPTPLLVNKLAVVLISPQGKKFYPWSLDPRYPEAAATRTAPNTVDNVNRIDIPATEREEAGVWRLVIDAAGVKFDQLGSGVPFGVAIAYYGVEPNN